MTSNSTVQETCAPDDRLCIVRTHQLDVIIVPVILLFLSLVTFMTMGLLKYCPGQRTRTRTSVPYPYTYNRESHAHQEGHNTDTENHGDTHRQNHRDTHRENHGDTHRQNHRDTHRENHRDTHRQNHRNTHRDGHGENHRDRHRDRDRNHLHGIDAPPGINPMEHEEMQMSVHPNFTRAPETSTQRLHGRFSQVTALPLTITMRPDDIFTIHRARIDGKDVILRVLKDSANNQQQQYFVGFTSFLSGLGPHPFIPAVLGVVSVQPPPMLVLEELQYRDLLGFLWGCRQNNSNNNYTEKRLFIMAGQVASALEYLHSQSCIHGNLGARSVLIGGDLSAKLWGLTPAYHRKTQTQVPDGVEVMEMKKWQAPEVLARQSVSQSSDVWSFGILLYEMISLGDPPFRDVTTAEILQHLQRGKHVKKPANCSNSLYSIIKACCQFRTQQRPSVSALLQKIRAGERSANERTVIASSQPIDTERYLREAGIGVTYNFALM